MSGTMTFSLDDIVDEKIGGRLPYEIANEVEAALNQITVEFQEEYELLTGQTLDWMSVFQALKKCIEPSLTEIAISKAAVGCSNG